MMPGPRGSVSCSIKDWIDNFQFVYSAGEVKDVREGGYLPDVVFYIFLLLKSTGVLFFPVWLCNCPSEVQGCFP